MSGRLAMSAIATWIALGTAAAVPVTTSADDAALMSSMSIVGVDMETGDVGIALASKFFAVDRKSVV